MLIEIQCYQFPLIGRCHLHSLDEIISKYNFDTMLNFLIHDKICAEIFYPNTDTTNVKKHQPKLLIFKN
jgi:hypothetical protein